MGFPMFKFKKLMSVCSLITILTFSFQQTAHAGTWLSQVRGPAHMITSPQSVGYYNVAGNWVSTAIAVGAGATPLMFNPWAAAGAVILGVAAGGYLAYMYFSDKPKAIGSGKVTLSDANVTYVNLDNQEVALTGAATVNISDILVKAKADPSKYPNLNEDLQRPATPTVITADGIERGLGGGVASRVVVSGSAADAQYYYPSESWKFLGTVTWPSGTYTNVIQHTLPDYNVPGAYQVLYTEVDIVPEYMTESEFASKLGSGDANVDGQYIGEIDDMIKSNPNIVHFPDLPIITDIANDYTVITTSATAAQEAAATAASSAAAASSSAQTSAASAQAALSSHASASAASAAAQTAVVAAQNALSSATTAAEMASAQAALAVAQSEAYAYQLAADAAARAADSAVIAAVTGGGAAMAQALVDMAAAQSALADAAAISDGNITRDTGKGEGDAGDDADGVIGWLRKIRDTLGSAWGTLKESLQYQKDTRAADDAAINAMEAPGAPVLGNYTGAIDPASLPEKKDIPGALADFLLHSPVVTLIKSLSVSASNDTSVISFQFRGETITGDFGQYDGVIGGAGSAMLVIVHGLAMLIIFKRE